ncbi:unnamed protein product [Didymodactylos carnosus]|uniref:Uncharacterized protein n=1 Tax=Didymodactylos carnosus TaxID=1234261 RepID=A0A813P291_9BILA|nr:unnamed protein product [Didymodactylos carnosus]CAF1222853.1 unnamed protein product [Didymodactylos carnosus]CAF3523481.1 unnamed protein product [Didymodactylos carnosus]CAF4031030.1 unnamed protein product [Didymodactylos carnosus]
MFNSRSPMEFLLIITFSIFQQVVAFPGTFMSGERDNYGRFDPDSTLNGFFPFWGFVLLILSMLFLIIAAIGFIGYLVGCRSPPERFRQTLDPATFYP